MMRVLSEAHARRCRLSFSEEEHAVPAALREAPSSCYKGEDGPRPFEGMPAGFERPPGQLVEKVRTLK